MKKKGETRLAVLIVMKELGGSYHLNPPPPVFLLCDIVPDIAAHIITV